MVKSEKSNMPKKMFFFPPNLHRRLGRGSNSKVFIILPVPIVEDSPTCVLGTTYERGESLPTEHRAIKLCVMCHDDPASYSSSRKKNATHFCTCCYHLTMYIWYPHWNQPGILQTEERRNNNVARVSIKVEQRSWSFSTLNIWTSVWWLSIADLPSRIFCTRLVWCQCSSHPSVTLFWEKENIENAKIWSISCVLPVSLQQCALIL